MSFVCWVSTNDYFQKFDHQILCRLGHQEEPRLSEGMDTLRGRSVCASTISGGCILEGCRVWLLLLRRQSPQVDRLYKTFVRIFPSLSKLLPSKLYGVISQTHFIIVSFLGPRLKKNRIFKMTFYERHTSKLLRHI